MRTIHRWTVTVAGLLIAYLAITGSGIQIIDLYTLLSNAPASNANMESIREGINGAPGYAVIASSDYAAPDLPANADTQQWLNTVLNASRQAAPDAVINYLELRMAGDTPVGIVSYRDREPALLTFNALTGTPFFAPPTVQSIPARSGRSAHDTIKRWHRGDAFGGWAVWLNLFMGIALFVALVTGIVFYFQLLKRRWATGRKQVFWS